MEDEREIALLLKRWEAVQRQSEELLRAYDALIVRLDPPSPSRSRPAAAPPSRRRRPRLRVLRHPTLHGV